MRRTGLVVLVTCPSRASARRLAAQLIRSRVAACVNLIGRVESLFWWKGKSESAREYLLIIKTSQARFEALRLAIVARHPYEVPEVIALPIVAGHQPYLAWVHQAVRPASRNEHGTS